MPNNPAVQAQIDERRTKVIRLRRTKTPFGSDAILSLGYSSESAARKDFYRAIEIRRKDLGIEATAYREEQNEVLEALLETYLPIALDDKDIKAAELVLKTLDRQAKLNGWEEALKAQLTGPGGGPIPIGPVALSELQSLINTAGDPDPDDDEGDVEDADGEDPDDDGDNT